MCHLQLVAVDSERGVELLDRCIAPAQLAAFDHEMTLKFFGMSADRAFNAAATRGELELRQQQSGKLREVFNLCRDVTIEVTLPPLRLRSGQSQFAIERQIVVSLMQRAFVELQPPVDQRDPEDQRVPLARFPLEIRRVQMQARGGPLDIARRAVEGEVSFIDRPARCLRERKKRGEPTDVDFEELSAGREAQWLRVGIHLRLCANLTAKSIKLNFLIQATAREFREVGREALDFQARFEPEPGDEKFGILQRGGPPHVWKGSPQPCLLHDEAPCLEDARFALAHPKVRLLEPHEIFTGRREQINVARFHDDGHRNPSTAQSTKIEVRKPPRFLRNAAAAWEVDFSRNTVHGEALEETARAAFQ